MNEQMSLWYFANLPAERQKALDIFKARNDPVGLRLDYIVKARDQAPVRCIHGELGQIGHVRAKERGRASPQQRNAPRVPRRRIW